MSQSLSGGQPASAAPPASTQGQSAPPPPAGDEGRTVERPASESSGRDKPPQQQQEKPTPRKPGEGPGGQREQKLSPRERAHQIVDSFVEERPRKDAATPPAAEEREPVEHVDEPDDDDEDEGRDTPRKSEAKPADQQSRKDPKAEERKTPDESPERKQQLADAEARRTAEEPEEDEDAEFADLDDDEVVDKIFERAKKDEKSPKWYRRKLDTVENHVKAGREARDFVDSLGGREGAQQLVKYADALVRPEKFDDFHAIVKSSPHYKLLANQLFWGEIDSPDVLDKVVQDQAKNILADPARAKEWNSERVAALIEAVDAGEIDLDDIVARRDMKLSAEARAQKDKDRQQLNALLEESKARKLKEAEEEKKLTAQAIETESGEMYSAIKETFAPIARRFKMFWDPKDSDAVKAIKDDHFNNVLWRVEGFLAQDQDFQNLELMRKERQSKMKGADGKEEYTLAYRIALQAVAKKAKAAFKEHAARMSPYLIGAIAQVNRRAASRQQQEGARGTYDDEGGDASLTGTRSSERQKPGQQADPRDERKRQMHRIADRHRGDGPSPSYR